MVGAANALCALLADILPAHHALRLRLPGIRQPAAHADLEAQLARLIYRGFVLDTPAASLAQLPRYLKAAQLRLDKLAREPGRDAARLVELTPHLKRIQNYCPDRATAAFSEYRWLVEELRVSLFAQELGTAAKVSNQRLEKLWRETGAGK
jgi:ATP-dependent helicase HrpA